MGRLCHGRTLPPILHSAPNDLPLPPHPPLQLTAGKNAKWYSAGIMPYPRVMGDGLVLCDGTIFFSGGASKGVMVRAGARRCPGDG